MGADAWELLRGQLEATFGRFGAVVVHERRQTARPGVAALLVRDGEHVGFVKAAPRKEPLQNESRALQLIEAAKPRSFWAPAVRDAGTIDGWHYLVTTALPGGMHHRVRNAHLGAVIDEIDGALSALPRPAATPPGWRPMHGDLAPWNLRQVRGGPMALFDWEHAGWGPPGADEVYYRSTDAALGGTPATSSSHHDAIAYWRAELQRRSWTPGTERFARALALALDIMEGPVASTTGRRRSFASLVRR